MLKKSQSISINTIIIAAIALAVLVVLFIVFTGRFKIFSEGVKDTSLTCDKSCKAVGYSRGDPRFGSCSTSEFQTGKFEGMSEGQVCCCVS
ncbi:hypothetical protein HYW20_01485 [Candidatus Woesearchaeota archaeon]|nr:hypothetical protein [Candidatus Woesearchaeota archaeon]